MPPKRKAFAELSGNVSQQSDVPRSGRIQKRQRQSAKSTTKESNPVGGGVHEDAIGSGKSSRTPASGKSVPNERGSTGGRTRVDAKTLLELPEFQPFRLEYAEHSAQVGRLYFIIKEIL